MNIFDFFKVRKNTFAVFVRGKLILTSKNAEVKVDNGVYTITMRSDPYAGTILSDEDYKLYPEELASTPKESRKPKVSGGNVHYDTSPAPKSVRAKKIAVREVTGLPQRNSKGHFIKKGAK